MLKYLDFQIEDLTNDSGEPIRDRFNNPLTRVVPVFNPSLGSGNAGILEITVDSLELEDGGRIVAESFGGNGGNIQLVVDDLLILSRNSSISSTAGLEGSGGNGGNINIDANLILAFPNENNDIIANAFNGSGGNIHISAEGVLGLEQRSSNPPNNTNDIDASSEFGQSGNVTFNVPDTNNFQETAELSSNVVSAESVAEDACAATGQSGLVLKGKGGVPPAPNLPLSSAILLDNGKPITPNFSQLNNQQQAINNNTFQIQPVKTSVGDIYPARGVIVREDGTVTLTAYPTNNIATRTPENAVNCNQTMQ